MQKAMEFHNNQFDSSNSNNSHTIHSTSNRTRALSHQSSQRSPIKISSFKCRIFLRTRIKPSTRTSRSQVNTLAAAHRMSSNRSILRELRSTSRASNTNLTRMMWLSRSNNHHSTSSKWVWSWHQSITIRSKTSWKSRPRTHIMRSRYVRPYKLYPGVSLKSPHKLGDKTCTLTSILTFLSWKSKSRIRSSINLFQRPNRWESKSSLSSLSMLLLRNILGGVTCFREKTSWKCWSIPCSARKKTHLSAKTPLVPYRNLVWEETLNR